MKVYKINTKIIVPTDIISCWDFFSNPFNLEKLTPGEVFLKIDLTESEPIYPGMLISYIVKPFRNLQFNWLTEITAVQKNRYFIDEQRFGPYKFWHHQHTFKPVRGGVEIADEVNYVLPFGILGRILHPIIVKTKLEEIFNYRNRQIEKIFNYGK